MSSGAAKWMVGLIASEHVLFLIVEMFLWTKSFTWKRFGLTEEFARQSKALAGNMGLYNGFLAAGLAWSLLAAASRISPMDYARPLAIFFLGCVVVAGIYGGFPG